MAEEFPRNPPVNPPRETADGIPPSVKTAPERGTGSLWPGDDDGGGLFFEDLKARRVGDIVTVRIVENSRGAKNASTKTEKDSSLKSSIASLFGMATDTLSVETETATKFDGSGSTSRSSQLTAVVTARVTEVLPNGNMVIDGKREVLVNKERQYILLSGIVRPEDIGTNNTVLSSYIADANISYTGSGVINDKQRPGSFIRIFDFIWPF
ncbi:MAG: flagellar basal body L-ring protein FlgH [Nitrospirae bacterium]|nr:flagellar basal body L-ring protein FlgH [Nitrospirota bacterium]